MATKEPKKEYNRSQCVYGPNSTMHCMFCSALCKERYEDFKECGIKVEFINVSDKTSIAFTEDNCDQQYPSDFINGR